MIEYTCEQCGKVTACPPSQYKRSSHHYCSALCRNRHNNAIKNKTLMTDEVKQKLRMARLGTGASKTYEKTYGRHTHRRAAEELLGRPLRKGEVVHHINGNKRDNELSNLIVFASQAEHATWHARERRRSREVCPETTPTDSVGVPAES